MKDQKMRDKQLIEKTIEHLKRIVEVRKTISSSEQLKEDKTVQESLLFNFLQVGENFSHLSNKIIAQNNDIPFCSVIGFRNIIAHGYGTLKLNEVYEYLTKDIDPLINQLIGLLEQAS